MGGVLAGCRDAIMTGAATAQNLRMVDRVCGRERIGVMAVFADIGGLNVRRAFTGRLGTVVATDAVSGDVGVVEGRGHPAGCRVTVVAVVAAVYVSRMLAACCDAVMTGVAGAYDLGVINRKDGRKHICAVAVLADIGGLNVRRAFTRGFDAIMAVDAIARDIDVIEIRRQPASCRMTIVAGVTTGNVVWILAHGRKPIVTRTTCSRYLRVIDRVCRRESIGVVAVLADVGGRYVGWVLARGVGAIVATGTSCRDIDVIEICRHPACCRMTIVTGIAGVQVRGMLAGRGDAVMT